MTIEQIMPALRGGQVVGLRSRPERSYHLKGRKLFCIEHRYGNDYPRYQIAAWEVLADDWEIRAAAEGQEAADGKE